MTTSSNPNAAQPQPPAAGEAAHTVLVPLVFWSDHEDRGLPTPKPTERKGTKVRIPLFGAETDELLADAKHYAHPDGPLVSIGMVRSAKATVFAIEEARASIHVPQDWADRAAREVSATVVGQSNERERQIAEIFRRHACNSHAALVEALEEMLEQFGHYCEHTEDPAEIAAHEQARAALAAAKV